MRTLVLIAMLLLVGCDTVSPEREVAKNHRRSECLVGTVVKVTKVKHARQMVSSRRGYFIDVEDHWYTDVQVESGKTYRIPWRIGEEGELVSFWGVE